MRHYFCYSSSLDSEAFQEWKASHGYESFALPKGQAATALGVAYVFDFPSRYWGGRVLSLAKLTDAAQPADVHGLLFEISDSSWPVVQHKEGVVTGSMIEMPVQVLCGSKILMATAFVTNPERVSVEGPVSLKFLETVLKAYESSGLPVSARDSVRQAAGYSLNTN